MSKRLLPGAYSMMARACWREPYYQMGTTQGLRRVLTDLDDLRAVGPDKVHAHHKVAVGRNYDLHERSSLVA